MTVDGEVQPVEAELLGPPRQSTQDDDNTTHNAIHDDKGAVSANVIKELGGETN